jgi:hypothetical protein
VRSISCSIIIIVSSLILFDVMNVEVLYFIMSLVSYYDNLLAKYTLLICCLMLIFEKKHLHTSLSIYQQLKIAG